MQVFDALLSDLFYDWLNKWPYHDINQSYMVLESQEVKIQAHFVHQYWGFAQSDNTHKLHGEVMITQTMLEPFLYIPA